MHHFCCDMLCYQRFSKDHPPMFYARPETKPDGELNLFKWKCGIPGKGKLQYTLYNHS